MSFLPEGYKEPVESSYLKFVQGENTFRVLSSAIVGNEFWQTTTVDGKEVRKPIRRRMDEQINVSELNDNETPKHFWAFVVYSRQNEKIMILEITQKGIMKSLRALTKSPKWGDPKDYDITVTREGEGLETTYSVMPEPREAIDEGIIKLYKDMKIDLEQLFSGGDPFNPSTKLTNREVDDINDELDEVFK